jgi:outer membrane receptor protein involved in Fe transport
MMRTSVLLLAGTAFAAIAAPAFAQTEPAETPLPTGPTTAEAIAQIANQPEETFGDDIIVTATKRASTIQDVPFSINAQTQENIQRANAQNIEDISRNVAGLTVQNLGPGQSQVAVRGVSAGQIVRDQPGVKEQVGVYLDESVISLSLFMPDFDLFDLNRVETLRGPQGTLFGSGSVGGTLRFITNQPILGVTEGLVEANVNTVDESDVGYHLKGAVNVPLGPTLALRAVGYGTHYAGFVDAVGPAGGKNVNDGSRVGGRLALLWEPTESIRITPRVVYQEIRTDGFNRGEFYNFYTSFTTEPEVGERTQYLKLREAFEDETLLADLTASVVFGAVELTSITSYIDREILVSRDASALTGSVGIVPLVSIGVDPAIAGLPSNLRDTTDLSQWTQELRLSSIGTGPFQWVAGLFYTDIDRLYQQRLPTPGYDAFIDSALGAGVSAAVSNGFPLNSPYNANLPYDINQKAVFGEATYDFGQFELTAGGRYYDFEEERDFVSGGIFSNGDTRIGDKTSSNGFTPRVIGTYEPNRNLSFNVQAAKGFRLGGVNDPLNIPLCAPDDATTFGDRPTYDDETLWNYEAGFKYQARGMTFNAAAFYTDISDLQVTADAGSCSSRVVFNVPKAHTMGVEAEFAVTPFTGFDVTAAASLIEAEFDSDVTTVDGDIIAGIREGNRLPSVPKFQMAVTATYGDRLNANSDWYVNGSIQHVGNRFTQPSDQEPGASVFDFIFFDPNTLAFGTGSRDVGSLRLPAYELVSLSAGIEWDSGLEVVAYVNNLLDENPLLSLDRERGGRARLGFNIGQPRTIGLTVRQSFGR